ncbi:MAG: hypothetical protein VX951_06040 [Planctomycetota bacterium]|nr:hypothetical protein [Planctomycetota bacterium]
MSLRRSTRSRLYAAFKHRASCARLWRELAASETSGAADLRILARRQGETSLRKLLEGLAKDAERHATALRDHAATIETSDQEDTVLPFDFTAGRRDETRDCHGFPRTDGFEDLDAISYLATLKVAVQGSQDLYALCSELSPTKDPDAVAICQSILGDLQDRADSIDRALEKHGSDRPLEVRHALRAARRSPFMAAWKRTGLRSGAGFSRGVLYIFYWTLMLPFGLLSRRSTANPRVRGDADQAASNSDLRSQLRSQY